MKRVVIVLMLLIGGFTSSAVASLQGPVWPAEVTYSSSGNAGTAGGQTFTYSGFDTTQYTELFWGPWAGEKIGISLNGATITGSEIMTFRTSPSLTHDNVATWTGFSSFFYWDGNDYVQQQTETRLTLTVNPMEFVRANEIDGSPSSIGVLAPVTTKSFMANILFEANFFEFGGWLPYIDGYNSIPTDPKYTTAHTFAGGFYASAAPVPIPGAALLLAPTLLGLVGFRKKFAA